jgi:flavodoxin long chain
MTAPIGIFYGSTYFGTAMAAEMIQGRIGASRADLRDVAKAKAADLAPYDLLLFGSSTYGLGALQHDWDTFIWELRKADLTGKKAALFVLGDQVVWYDTFVDSMGTIYDALLASGATVVGSWPTDGYTFQKSTGVRDGRFVGLALDKMNQRELHEERIAAWVPQVLREFGL